MTRVRSRLPAVLLAAAVLGLLAVSMPSPAGTYTFGTQLTLTQIRPSKESEPKTDKSAIPLLMRNALITKFSPRYNTFTKLAENSVVAQQGEEVEFALQNGRVFCVTVAAQKPSTKGVVLRLRNGTKNQMIDLRDGDLLILEVEKGENPLIIVLSFELLQADR